MESDRYIPNSSQGWTNVDSSLLDSLPSLEILYANQCESSPVPQDLATSTEAYFYHGGQVQWLNFFLAENRVGPGSPAGLSFIKRDGYKIVAKQVDQETRSHLSVSSVDLLHQPGSGGTTLAMQVLWDFRKRLRCAVLRDSEAQAQDIARQTIALFQAGGPNSLTTVLLLIENMPKAETRSLEQCVASSGVHGNVPVVIILNCKRIPGGNSQNRTDITCQMELSDGEKKLFIERESELQFNGRKSEQFHGFHIMRHSFSEDYVREVIIPDMNGVQLVARNTKLLAVLALLNSYAPGSSLLKSECQAFLGPPDPIHGGPSFEDRMEPFTGLLVTFSRREKLVSQDLVRIAHPLIATSCCRALEAAGLSLGETIKTLIKKFSKRQTDNSLLQTINDLLVNRRRGKQFSPLIDDLRERKPRDCVTILELACNMFPRNALIRQALARFFYLSNLQDYSQAENWARKAMRIMPNNSYVADTLGQLHKHHLKNKKPDSLCMQLELVEKAVAAFEAQWKVAEEEDEAGQEDAGGPTQTYYFFNSSGMFGYIQVANITIDIMRCLPSQEAMVLLLNAKEELLCGSITSNNFQTFLKYKTLLASFKDNVERIFSFFECFLTYSERDNDLSCMRENVNNCYAHYVTIGKTFRGQGADEIRGELKERTAASFPGLLHCLEMNNGIKEIAKMWKEVVHPHSPAHSLTDTLCYLLSNIALSCVIPESPDILPFSELTSTLHRLLREEHGPDREPELYFLALVSLWPGNTDSICSHHISNYVTWLQEAYQQHYHNHLRSRYIRSHFFLREGTEYSRLVHWSTVKRQLLANVVDHTRASRTFFQWRSQANWEKTELLRVKGVIKDRKIFACYGQREVLVHPDNMAQVRSPGCVTFHLGFNIRGPVAFDIQYLSGPVQHLL